jgi:prolipoprotein diacylglyceryltransferase
MRREKRYFCIIILPMIISIALDCFVELPDKWVIILYLILYGTATMLIGNEPNDEKTEKKKCSYLNYIISIPVFILSGLGLCFLKNRGDLLNNDFSIMLLQIGLSLICAICVVVCICTLILRKNKM